MHNETCVSCSQRQVACDGAKPSCKRCKKARRKCAGYDGGFRVVFYGEGGKRKSHTPTSVSTTRNRPRKITYTAHPPVNPYERRRTHADKAASDDSQLSVRNFFISRPLPQAQDLDMRSICLFISTFVPAPRYGTILDFVPDLHLTSNSTSCFQISLHAVSLLNFMNRYKAYNMLEEDVKVAYYAAIRSTNTALKDRELVLRDETLASVWLLSLYELLSSDVHTFGSKTPWIHHINGSLSLLRIRGRSKAKTKIGQQLFTLVYMPILAMIMMMGQQPPADIAKDYQEILQADKDCPPDLTSTYEYMNEVADWRARTRMACENLGSTGSDHVELIKVVALISEGTALSDYSERSTLKNGTNTKDPEISRTSENHSCNKFDYSSVNDLFHDLIKWTTNLLSIQTLLQATMMFQSSAAISDSEIKLLLANNEVARKTFRDTVHLQQRLNSLADLTLASVPFAFGDHVNDKRKPDFSIYNNASVGAYHMFWPLGALVASPWVTEDRKIRARAALKIIGERFCIIQAFRYI